jgi:A nuclease of the HNH/ENDO VII superfamily with conserved WHH
MYILKAGVPFKTTGFPDFSEHLYPGGPNDVMITPTGKRYSDFSAANKAAGYKSTPKGYTWHHHEDTGRMQLVDTKIHKTTAHTGGYAIWE